MATVYLYKFNNYYNRQVKKYDTLAEYGSYYYMETGTNANFNPNDGVNTMHVFGRQSNPYEGECDYLIYCKDNVNITSRWFIIEQTRKLVGQYELTLHRDVIVDNYNEVVSSPAFIEKATLRDDDILIYNKESIAVNQIKTSETLLKDTTDCAWICGYIPRSYAGGALNFSAANAADIILPDGDDITDWQYYQYIGDDVCKLRNRRLEFRAGVSAGYYSIQADYYVYSSGLWNYTNLPTGASGATAYFGNKNFNEVRDSINNNYVAANLWNSVSPYLTGVTYDASVYNTLKGIRGKIIKAGNNYYKVDIALSDKTYVDEVTVDKTGAPLYTNWKNLIIAAGAGSYSQFKGFIQSSGENLVMTLEPLPQGEYKIVMPSAIERYHLKDAPYDMFCIPYAVEKESVKVKSTGTSSFTELAISSSQAMSIAQGIAEAIGQANIYDLQLLPYCPMSGFDLTHAVDTSTIDIKAADSKRYTMVTNTTATPVNKAVILWSLASQGSLNITKPITVVNKKIENQTDRYRICSPNYNGTFDFSVASNDGVDYFNVDYTYLPYNPYIHINPNFKNLYGNDYNDARGMIVQGDFSIAYLSDAWANYQVQNKNYLNIFNRGIQNMETNNRLGNEQQLIAGHLGALQGAAMGAMAGGTFGTGPAGAIVGGVVGLAASGAGLAADMHYTRALQNEALDYTKDNFGYNLQNIQALPDSIAKTTAYTANNKVFPILEYYTCKDEEKMIFANKIAWNGMTVMAIGSISSYLNNSWTYGGITDKGYIKGQLIRLEGIYDDYHMLKAISEEINKGAYFK